MANQLNELDPKIQQAISDFGKRTHEKILKNFELLKIGEYNPTYVRSQNKRKRKNKEARTPGALRRKIHWQVFKAAGGDTAKVDFFYNHYAMFVELGVGKGVKYTPLPKIKKLKAIKRKDTKRTSKPFLLSEIRLHARITLEHFAEYYAYTGGYHIVKNFGIIGRGKKRKDLTKMSLSEIKQMFE